jgi:TatD DNase family protein
MIIDTHCHLHAPEFADLRETLGRALTDDVWGVVAVGCDAATNEATLAAAAAAPKSVWACLGYHPDWLHPPDELDRVEAQIHAQHAHIVGLGEVGLPWYCLEGDPDAASRMAEGEARLRRLLDLAVRYDLPVALHAPHGAAVGALQALTRRRIDRAVFHWHKAPADITRRIVDAGYFVSVTPDLIYRERDREMVEWLPLETLLVESDGPWTYTGEFDGMPSGPWFASRVAEEVAKLKQLPVDEVMFQLSTNACRLFDLVWA